MQKLIDIINRLLDFMFAFLRPEIGLEEPKAE